MGHRSIILHLICLVALSGHQAITLPTIKVMGDDAFDVAAFCSAREPGVYPDAQSNCTNFYVCEDIAEQSSHWSCRSGASFDTQTCACQDADGGACQPEDKCSISAKVSALEDASKDPGGLTTPPRLNATRSTSCTGKATGLYPSAESACQNYYACVKGVAHVYPYSCPKYFAFDHGKCQCLPAHLARCQDTATPCFPAPPPPRPSTTLPPPPPPSDFCRGKGPGYYTDVNRGCEWFFVCSGGNFQTYQFRCPSHLRFNHFTCNCDYPYAAPCTIFNEVPCFQPKNSDPRALL